MLRELQSKTFLSALPTLPLLAQPYTSQPILPYQACLAVALHPILPLLHVPGATPLVNLSLRHRSRSRPVLRLPRPDERFGGTASSKRKSRDHGRGSAAYPRQRSAERVSQGDMA